MLRAVGLFICFVFIIKKLWLVFNELRHAVFKCI